MDRLASVTIHNLATTSVCIVETVETTSLGLRRTESINSICVQPATSKTTISFDAEGAPTSRRGVLGRLRSWYALKVSAISIGFPAGNTVKIRPRKPLLRKGQTMVSYGLKADECYTLEVVHKRVEMDKYDVIVKISENGRIALQRAADAFIKTYLDTHLQPDGDDMIRADTKSVGNLLRWQGRAPGLKLSTGHRARGAAGRVSSHTEGACRFCESYYLRQRAATL